MGTYLKLILFIDENYTKHKAAFPLAPEHDYIEADMFSPFMKSYYSSLCHARGVKDRYKSYRKLLMTQ